MSTQPTPASAFLEWQRNALEQTRQATARLVKLQQDVNHAWLDSWESQESIQQRGIEVTRSMLNTYLAMVASAQPGAQSTATIDEFRADMDGQFEEFAERHQQFMDDLEEIATQNVEVFDEFSEGFLEVYDDQIDSMLSDGPMEERATTD